MVVGGGSPSRGLQFSEVSEDSEKSLDELTVAELRERASAHEITGRSSMSKDELVQSVRDADEQVALMESSGSSRSESSSGTAQASASGSASKASDDNEENVSGITAPSIGPNTTIEHVPPDERLDMDKISDVDAMGLDKRRQVGGKRYGASPAKQALVYGGALAVIAGLVIGGKLLADELDQPPAVQEEFAPWADAEQKPPAPIDFPRSTEQ